MEITHNVYHSTRNLLCERGKLYGIADEGGFWPEVSSNEEAFEIVLSGIERAGYVPGHDVSLSLDIAASDLYDTNTRRYSFPSENRSFDTGQFVEFLVEWCKKYPIVSIEDPMADTDMRASAKLGHSAPRERCTAAE
jgi:enolase